MPREFSRTRRIAELLQRELANIITRELDDPRIGMVTITGVDVSKDLSLAKIYVTQLEKGGAPDELVAALNRAAGYLRKRLSSRLDLRVTPKLNFKYDSSVERGVELAKLIDRAVLADTKQGPG